MRLIFLVGLALLLFGCAPPISPASNSAETSSLPQPDAASWNDTLTSTDGIKHSVPLEKIYFDTFRRVNRAVPFPDASDKLKADLLDAIPPINNPVYESATAAAWLQPDDLIIGYTSGGSAWAFPINILNYHEIVNDTLDGQPVLISYCPLCFSGIVFSRNVADQTLTFGNTSALYESDMVMVDYETGSYWWQVAGSAIVGELTSATMDVLPSQTATWQEWQSLYPESSVLSRDTGFQRDYSRNAFASYAQALDRGRFAFPVSDSTAKNNTLPASTPMLSVTLGDTVRAYPLVGESRAIMDEVDGQSIVVFIDGEQEIGNAFWAGGRDFNLAKNSFQDRKTGSSWRLSGQAIAGPLAGESLEPLPIRTTFWFAIISAEPNLTLVR